MPHPDDDRLLSICPDWCTGEHEVDDDLRLVHRSDGIVVPGVERVSTAEGEFSDAQSVDLVVGLQESAGETWVWLSPAEDVSRSLVLTMETARRLWRLGHTVFTPDYLRP
jgi:hypothetical protein